MSGRSANQEYDVKSIAGPMEVWATPRPREEAKALLALAARMGETLADVIALVGLDAKEQRELLEFVREYPQTADGVERALAFRVRVADELEALAKNAQRGARTYDLRRKGKSLDRGREHFASAKCARAR